MAAQRVNQPMFHFLLINNYKGVVFITLVILTVRIKFNLNNCNFFISDFKKCYLE